MPMFEYAKLSPDNTQVLYTSFYKTTPVNISSQFRIVINDDIPMHNATTHKIVDAGLVIEPNQVRRLWEVIPLEASELKQSWTPLEFWNRFTEQERLTIFTLSKDNEPLRLWITMLGIATLIENDHPLTISAMNDLVVGGLLSEDRKNEILGLI